MDIINIPEFPDVPDVDGVPLLNRDPQGEVDTFPDTEDIQNTDHEATQTWGIFDADGKSVIDFDSMLAFEYGASSRMSDYPLEQGKFASYNKVGSPFSARVRLFKSGSEADRTSFLNKLEFLASSENVTLYTILTPEYGYENVNVESYDYRRDSRNGAHSITADLMVRQIRTSATAEYTSFQDTKNPSSADPVTTGQVQPVELVNPVSEGDIQ